MASRYDEHFHDLDAAIEEAAGGGVALGPLEQPLTFHMVKGAGTTRVVHADSVCAALHAGAEPAEHVEMAVRDLRNLRHDDVCRCVRLEFKDAGLIDYAAAAAGLVGHLRDLAQLDTTSVAASFTLGNLFAQLWSDWLSADSVARGDASWRQLRDQIADGLNQVVEVGRGLPSHRGATGADVCVVGLAAPVPVGVGAALATASHHLFFDEGRLVAALDRSLTYLDEGWVARPNEIVSRPAMPSGDEVLTASRLWASNGQALRHLGDALDAAVALASSAKRHT